MNVRNLSWAVLAVLLIGVGGPARGGENLLRNGDFAAFGDGSPAEWRIDKRSPHQVTQEPTALGKSCMKIWINEAQEGQGQVSQRVTGIKANTKYVLKGQVKNSAPRIAILQVKLLKGREELKRISSDKVNKADRWEELAIALSSGEADSVLVLCRYDQDIETAGQSVWFSDLSLVEAVE